MTATELERSIKQRLEAKGLLQYLDRNQEQYLELEDELFAEIVLVDATKVPDARESLQQVADELSARDLKIDWIVRGAWTVDGDAEFVGAARSLSGGIKAAEEWVVPIRCGSVKKQVRVEMTVAAMERLQQRLGLAARTDIDPALLAKAAKEFVAFELSLGGQVTGIRRTTQSGLSMHQRCLIY